MKYEGRTRLSFTVFALALLVVTSTAASPVVWEDLVFVHLGGLESKYLAPGSVVSFATLGGQWRPVTGFAGEDL